jgi:hypothetical protein
MSFPTILFRGRAGASAKAASDAADQSADAKAVAKAATDQAPIAVLQIVPVK